MVIYLGMLLLHGATNHVSSEYIGWLAMLTSVIALGGGILGKATEASLLTDHHHVWQETDRCLMVGMQIMPALPDACEAARVPPLGSCMACMACLAKPCNIYQMANMQTKVPHAK